MSYMPHINRNISPIEDIARSDIFKKYGSMSNDLDKLFKKESSKFVHSEYQFGQLSEKKAE